MDKLYLSRNDIEAIAIEVIELYKAKKIPQRHLMYSVDLLELANMLGLSVDQQRLSYDGTILGMTAPDAQLVSIIGPNGEEYLYPLDGKTTLVESRLWDDPRLVGRRNFTLAHEIAHQILYQRFPGAYGIDNRILCDYRRSGRRVTNWHEWQADALGAAIFLPRDAILDGMLLCNLGERVHILSKKYTPNKYEDFCHLAELLQASLAALAFRMEQLGLLEKNRLFA